MKKQPEVWKDLLLQALQKHIGMVGAACKEVGISRNQYHVYYRTDEEFKAKVDEIMEGQIDMVETELLKKIKSGSEKSIHFYLKYKARKRGYNEQLDITTNGKSINDISVIKIIEVRGEDNGPDAENDESIY